MCFYKLMFYNIIILFYILGKQQQQRSKWGFREINIAKIHFWPRKRQDHSQGAQGIRLLRPSTSTRTFPISIGTRIWSWTPSGTLKKEPNSRQYLETLSANWSQHHSSWRWLVVLAERSPAILEFSNLFWKFHLVLLFIYHEPLPVYQVWPWFMSQ